MLWQNICTSPLNTMSSCASCIYSCSTGRGDITYTLWLCVKSCLFILCMHNIMLQLLSLTCCRTTDICSPMQRSLPKLAGKLSVLYLTNVSFSRSCVVGLVHLLNSSLKDLHLSYCILTSDEYDYLTTAIATSTLEKFYFDADVMTKEMANSLARLLTLTKSLEVVRWWLSSADCDVNAVAHVQTLVEAMAHSIVKELRLPSECKDAIADMPYPKDRVKF